jgi:hypothetical protein
MFTECRAYRMVVQGGRDRNLTILGKIATEGFLIDVMVWVP